MPSVHASSTSQVGADIDLDRSSLHSPEDDFEESVRQTMNQLGASLPESLGVGGVSRALLGCARGESELDFCELSPALSLVLASLSAEGWQRLGQAAGGNITTVILPDCMRDDPQYAPAFARRLNSLMGLEQVSLAAEPGGRLIDLEGLPPGCKEVIVRVPANAQGPVIVETRSSAALKVIDESSGGPYAGEIQHVTRPAGLRPGTVAYRNADELLAVRPSSFVESDAVEPLPSPVEAEAAPVAPSAWTKFKAALSHWPLIGRLATLRRAQAEVEVVYPDKLVKHQAMVREIAIMAKVDPMLDRRNTRSFLRTEAEKVASEHGLPAFTDAVLKSIGSNMSERLRAKAEHLAKELGCPADTSSVIKALQPRLQEHVHKALDGHCRALKLIESSVTLTDAQKAELREIATTRRLDPVQIAQYEKVAAKMTEACRVAGKLTIAGIERNDGAAMQSTDSARQLVEALKGVLRQFESSMAAMKHHGSVFWESGSLSGGDFTNELNAQFAKLAAAALTPQEAAGIYQVMNSDAMRQFLQSVGQSDDPMFCTQLPMLLDPLMLAIGKRAGVDAEAVDQRAREMLGVDPYDPKSPPHPVLLGAVKDASNGWSHEPVQRKKEQPAEKAGAHEREEQVERAARAKAALVSSAAEQSQCEVWKDYSKFANDEDTYHSVLAQAQKEHSDEQLMLLDAGARFIASPTKQDFDQMMTTFQGDSPESGWVTNIPDTYRTPLQALHDLQTFTDENQRQAAKAVTDAMKETWNVVRNDVMPRAAKAQT